MTDRRALLTDREREIIAGDADVDDSYRYQTISRVRARFDRLEGDLEALEQHGALADELREVVCDAPPARSPGDDTLTAAPATEGVTETAGETESHQELLRSELAGSGDLLAARVDEMLKMYDHLRDRGKADRDELLSVVDVDATGYQNAESVWANMVKGKDTLRALPGVKTPPTGRSEWKYVGDRDG